MGESRGQQRGFEKGRTPVYWKARRINREQHLKVGGLLQAAQRVHSSPGSGYSSWLLRTLLTRQGCLLGEGPSSRELLGWTKNQAGQAWQTQGRESPGESGGGGCLLSQASVFWTLQRTTEGTALWTWKTIPNHAFFGKCRNIHFTWQRATEKYHGHITDTRKTF